MTAPSGLSSPTTQVTFAIDEVVAMTPQHPEWRRAEPLCGPDVRRFKAHQAIAKGADVGDPDVVAKDDEYVWLARRWPGSSRLLCLRKATCGCTERKKSLR